MKHVNFLLIILLILIDSHSFTQEKSGIETQVQKGHIQPVSSISWHPSGDYFASGSQDHSIILWDVKTGKQIRSFNYHTGGILNLVFSKDGSQLLTSAEDNRILVIETITGKVLEEYNYDYNNSYPMSIDFSAKENYIIIGDNRDETILFDRKKKTSETYKKGFSAPVHALNLSPDESLKFVLNNYKESYLINRITNDSTLIEFDKPYHYSFSHDGAYLIVGSEKLFAKVYETETGKEINTIEAEENCDGCKFKIAISHDDKYLASYDGYSGLTVWKLNNGKKVFNIPYEKEGFNKISFNSQNQVILSGSSNFKIIDVSSEREVFSLKNEFTGYTRPKVSPDGKCVLSADAFFSTAIYQIANGKKSKQYKGFLNRPEAMVQQIDYGSWFNKNIVNHIKFKPSIDISSDGKYIAQGKTDTSVAVFNLESGKHLPLLKKHQNKVITVAFHPTQPQLVTGDAKGTVIIWDMNSQKELHQFRAHTGLIFDLSYNSDGSELISSSWDATIRHWSLQGNPKQIGYIDMNNVSPYKVMFSPDDLYIIAGDVFEKILIYETDTKKEVKQLIGHQNTVSDFVFTRDQNGQILLATASRDGWVKIWNFHSGMLVDKIRSDDNAAALSLEINPKSGYLYFGSADRKIYVYDLVEKKVKYQFQAHASGVNYLKIKGQKLYSKSIEGEVKIWSLYHTEPTEIMTYFQMTSRDWLFSHPLGYFDGSKKALEQINYVSGMKSLEVGSFFKKYYHPGLYEYLNNGNRFQGEEQGLENLINDGVPQFDIYFKNFQGASVLAQVDSVYQHNSSSVAIELQFPANYKNIEDILVYNNGKLIKKEPYEEDVVFRGINKGRSLEIDLIPNQNNLSVQLTTEEGLTTPKIPLQMHFDTLSGKTELFILSLGINKYENNNYNLKYADNDAKSFSNAITKGANDIFYKTYEYQISNQKVNKENVMRTLEQIKEKIGPEDVFIFYYAGHGMMYQNPDNTTDFYLIMSDITNLYGEKEMLENKGISAKNLLEISKNIPAQKQVFVLDACQSGAALNELAVRGVEREKTLAQLARNTGTFFLTAAQDIEFANEVGALEHGVFTYAILELLSGKTNQTKIDETITIYELKSYVESRVPELSRIHKGSPQYPTGYSFGNDFPIGMVK